MASEEVYGLKTVRLYRGQNWVALPVIPDSNTIANVLGHELPAGASQSDPDATQMIWYQHASNDVVEKYFWLLDWGPSNQWRTGTGWGFPSHQPADHYPVPYDDGFVIQIPTNTVRPYEQEGLLMFLGRVPTNTQTQVDHAQQRLQPGQHARAGAAASEPDEPAAIRIQGRRPSACSPIACANWTAP